MPMEQIATLNEPNPGAPPGSFGPGLSPGLSVDIRDIVGLLRRRLGIIAIGALLGGVLGLAIAACITPIYTASGEIVVKAESSIIADPDRGFHSDAINQAVVTTERDVLLADGLLARVADRVNMSPRVLAPGLIQSARAAVADGMLGIAQNGPVAWLLTSLGLDEKIHLASTAQNPQTLRTRRLNIVKSAVKTTASKDSSVITITANTVDPALSADIVNTILTLYFDDRTQFQNGIARTAEDTLRQRLQDMRAEIARREALIATESAQPGMIETMEIPDRQRALAISAARLADAKADLATRRSAYNAVLALQQQAAGNPLKLVEMMDQGSTSTADLRRQYLAASQELSALTSKKGPNYPEVAAARNQVNALQVLLSSEAARVVAQRRADASAAEATVAALQQQYDQQRTGATARASDSLTLDSDRGTLTSLRHMADVVQERLIDWDARAMEPNARLLSHATAPLDPDYPDLKWFNLGGAFLGALLSVFGLIVSFYVNHLRPSVGTQADWFNASLLGCLPDFGRGPRAREKMLQALRSGAVERDGAAIAFQGVALQLEDLLQRQTIRRLAVVSGKPNEGKSTVVVGLGMALASAGLRVVILDCDIRKPSIGPLINSTLVGAGNSDKCREVLELKWDLRNWKIMRDPASGVHFVQMPDVPSLAYLRSAEFDKNLEACTRCYDLVLVDTPPVMNVPDALLIAKKVDSMLVVAESDRHSVPEVSEIIRRIVFTRTPVCGVVLTKLTPEASATATYAGYEYLKSEARHTDIRQPAAPAIAAN
jgi:capsular exopolysaccharide synthesis family protein